MELPMEAESPHNRHWPFSALSLTTLAEGSRKTRCASQHGGGPPFPFASAAACRRVARAGPYASFPGRPQFPIYTIFRAMPRQGVKHYRSKARIAESLFRDNAR